MAFLGLQALVLGVAALIACLAIAKLWQRCLLSFSGPRIAVCNDGWPVLAVNSQFRSHRHGGLMPDPRRLERLRASDASLKRLCLITLLTYLIFPLCAFGLDRLAGYDMSTTTLALFPMVPAAFAAVCIAVVFFVWQGGRKSGEQPVKLWLIMITLLAGEALAFAFPYLLINALID